MGVAAVIVLWNFPDLLAMGKVAGAVYTGNTVLVKYSPFIPYCDLELAELVMLFFLSGIIRFLSDDTLGPMITDHLDIDKVAFIGSIATDKWEDGQLCEDPQACDRRAGWQLSRYYLCRCRYRRHYPMANLDICYQFVLG